MWEICDEYEARIGSLFGDVPQFKRWLDGVRGLTTDAQGRTVILGLDAAETEEMILLRATIRTARDIGFCAKSTIPHGRLTQ